MINFINISRLRNLEYLDFGKDLVEVCEPTMATDTELNQSLQSFKLSLQHLQNGVAQNSNSEIDTQLARADEKRDEAITGIKTVCEGFTLYFEEEKRNAALLLLGYINSYGTNLAHQNYASESESIQNLLKDFESNSNASQALHTLNLKAWADELKNLNDVFVALFNERPEDSFQASLPSLKSLRIFSHQEYEFLTISIKARQMLHPTDAQKQLISEINQVLSKYNLVISERIKNGDVDTVGRPF